MRLILSIGQFIRFTFAIKAPIPYKSSIWWTIINSSTNNISYSERINKCYENEIKIIYELQTTE